jgi:hypothetical protein
MPTSLAARRAIARVIFPMSRVIFAMFVVSSRALGAQDAVTTAVGGDGGDPYTVTCGTKAMVGLNGRYAVHLLSVYVDKIQPLCVSVDANGAWIGSPAPTSSYAGPASSRPDATSVSVVCPQGMAINGFVGETGIYVDRFWIFCQPMGIAGRVPSGQGFQQDAAIGSDLVIADFHGPFTCPGGKPAKGITGRAHDWIDKFALVCNYPAVPPPSIAWLGFNPATVVGGNQVTGQFELNAPALAGGASVGFSVQVLAADASKIPSSPISPRPSIVPAGQTQGSFVFTTAPVAAPVGVTINSPSQTVMVSRSFSILPPSLSGLGISPSRVAPGTSPTGTISLNGVAPAGGVSVSLTSSVPSAATVAPTIIVSQGQASAAFPVSVVATRSACTVLTASGVFTPPGGQPQRQLALAISAPANKTFALSMPNQAVGTTTATVTLAVATKEPHALTVSSSNPALMTAPASITVPAGGTSTTFPITIQGTPPAGTNCAVITATDRDGSASALVIEIVGSAMRRIG